MGMDEKERDGIMDIDFVIAWVDGSDREWLKRKQAYTGDEFTDDREERYRDWGLLKYWFRAVEQFAPWVHRVWMICDQEPPEWLNLDCPKLHIVRHEDYLPAEYRPAFSSHPIELNMHRIRGLSEHFVYFNDDMYLLSPVSEEFFFRNGLPVDSALLNPIPTVELKKKKQNGRVFTIPLNNAEVLNRDFDFRSCVKAHPLKWLNPRYGKNLLRNLVLMIWPRFVGFDEPHLPQAFLKQSFEEAWEQDKDVLDATSCHALRHDQDVNQWLIRYRQLAEGRFVPRSPKVGRVFDLDLDGNEAVDVIREQRTNMICMNDGALSWEAFQNLREGLTEAFESILPQRSCFERQV